MEEMKKRIKENILYVICFLIFVYIFYMIPPVCDRWMEGFLVEFEDPWRYVFCQYRWMQIANGRALSNLFSYFVDKNIIIHTIVNAFMMTGIFYLVYQMTKVKSIWRQLTIFACFFIIPWGLQREVYLYATTLFVSAAFLCVISSFLIIRILENDGKNFEKLLCGFCVFLSSLWLESSSLTVLVMLFLLIFYHKMKKKKVKLCLYFYLIINIIGFAFLFYVAKFAESGRLKNGIGVTIGIGRISFFIQQYYALFFLLSIVVLLKLFSYSKTKLRSVLIFMWGIVGISTISYALRDIYFSISTDPILGNVEDLKLIYGWKKFGFFDLSSFFEKFSELQAIIIFIVLGLSSILLFIFLEKKSELENYILSIGMGIGGSAIYFFGLESGNQDRVIFTGIIALIIFISELISDEVVTKKITKTFIVAIVSIAIINCETLITVVNSANNIQQERLTIINEVKVRQALGEWNYNTVVKLPSFDGSSSHGLVGGQKLNPNGESVYYDILLKYYGLDERTLVEFE